MATRGTRADYREGPSLPDYDRTEIEAKLNGRLAEIERVLGLVDVREQYSSGDELADYDQHPGDEGTETFEQELDEAKRAILHDERGIVQQALQRLEEGQYGICVDCGREIPAERLKAQPEAIRCVDDQRRFEAAHGTTGGPVIPPGPGEL
jgi:RNA polymerase-binding transcription factor DksA